MFDFTQRKYLTTYGIPLHCESKPKARYTVRGGHHIALYSNLGDDAWGLTGGFRDIALALYHAKQTILLSGWIFNASIHMPFFGKELGDGLVEHRQNALTDAKEFYQKIESNNPDYKHAQYFLAILNAQEGRYDEALVCIHASLTQNPTQALYRYVLIELYLLKNDLESAEKNIKIYESQPYTPYYLLAVAKLHAKKNELKEAKDIYRKALKKDEHCIMAYQGLIDIAIMQNNKEEARQQAINLRNFQPHHPLVMQLLKENKALSEIESPHAFFNLCEAYVAFMKTLPNLGELLVDKAVQNPNMLIAIQLWDRAINLGYPGNVTTSIQNISTRLYPHLDGVLPQNLCIQFINCTFGTSPHQKMLVLDDGQQALHAFYGSADLAAGKLDWHEHPLMNTDQNQSAAFNVYRTYQGEHSHRILGTQLRTPWREVQAHIRGAAAQDMAQEFARNWQTPTTWFSSTRSENRISVHLVKHQESNNTSGQGIWRAQLMISSPERNYEKSIHKAMLQAIYLAHEYIYLESQYFTQMQDGEGNVHNRIPDALVEKIIMMHNAGKPFHVYLVLPLLPNGEPGGMIYVEPVRELQYNTLTECMRKIEAATGESWSKYLSVISFAQWHGANDKPCSENTRAALVRHNSRYPVYVHSKCAIFDNTHAIIGSANINERSMDGQTDGEIAIYQFPDTDHTAACQQELKQFMLEKIVRPYFGLQIYNSLNAKTECAILPLCNPQIVSQIKTQANTNLFSYASSNPNEYSDPNTGLIVSLPFAQEKGQVGNLMPGISPFMPDAPCARFSSEPADTYRWFGTTSTLLAAAQIYNKFARLFS
jgi:phosphatidylserine/phosphatidylglycerophosphate/cardiolipin synthase-like enzyme